MNAMRRLLCAVAVAGACTARAPLRPGQATAVRFEQCWSFRNEGRREELKRCYARDAVSEAVRSGTPAATGPDAIVASIDASRTAFPDERGDIQLEIVSGRTLVSVVLITGTDAATGKKIGYYKSQVIELDDSGHATREREFFDGATPRGQLAPNHDQPVRPAVDHLQAPRHLAVASANPAERTNTATHRREIDGFNHRDLHTLEQIFDDRLVWFESPDAADYDKKQILENMQAFWKDFPDVQLTVEETWAAGDYVAGVVRLDGTNATTGKRLSLPFVEIYRFENGKARSVWVFYQSSDLVRQL
jgi:ketosteroid isomerase-like protein